MPALPTRARLRRTVAATAAAAALPLALSACGEAAEQITERAIEKAAEDAGGADVDIDADSGEVKVESSDGSFSYGTGKLPEGFPEEVPVTDGEIVSGASTTSGGKPGFVVQLQVPGGTDEVAARIGDELGAAGFTRDDEASAAGISSYENDAWEVIVGTLTEADGKTFVQYSVTGR
ncbi:hypothetical protein L615_006600000030 [Nocardioides sp. J9]|uniref:hypothetical protein n=1 Tax=Nocardioides sp. J9 TaxID=935844 RepID=UPI0011AA52C2|nr:hypothetical protein [Nocardioides sp. J9]TWG92296.1 hypothetical protein L615_007200000030 [Nocardioides sp. J9]TWG93044.1 hypothetical protein L615_006600000030 [Nocardioides sp. J9]